MTLPEVLLWQALRARPTGLKFRRQHPSGPYVLDFYCEEASLAIEVDGMAHDSRQKRDAERDEWLAARGIRSCRIPAEEVLADPGAVTDAIVAAARALTPPPSFGRSPSPSGRI